MDRAGLCNVYAALHVHDQEAMTPSLYIYVPAGGAEEIGLD